MLAVSPPSFCYKEVTQPINSCVGKFINSFKGDRYGSNIDEAIEALEEAVKDFEAEARICDGQRLGQIDKITKGTHAKTQNIEQGVRELTEGWGYRYPPAGHG